MVDILCSVLSGGHWGPTVDGFTTNKVNYGGAKSGAKDGKDTKGDGEGGEGGEGGGEEGVEGGGTIHGIGHFFGALRIDGFRSVSSFKGK